ncbi:MAG: hypothetical protein Q8916_01615 [Bacteroidota bacterium]|nr:hypothetical protein [Bacteroidota bacterium]MDP4229084.1 hypothetical protein [Bacteroidota bacterium]MDP4235042.1 hypothetical protein [Bacteroidota bacterium]
MSPKKAKSSPPVSKRAAPPAGRNKFLTLLAGIVVLCVGLYQAIGLRWVSDDAFITYRYVKNFVEGHGIVYNPGEYVEGYTHFLWLLILSVAKAIGLDPVDASMWLGIAAYTGILILFLIISRKEQKRNSHSEQNSFFIPLAALLLALNYDMAVWASGGLETALYTFLISLSFFTWFYTELETKKKLLTTGCILLLATLTRPDGALFILAAFGLLIVMGLKQKISFAITARSIGLLVLPVLAFGIPYLFWKYSYYGDIFPTTYYAKSADQNYFGQGFFYIWLFFRVYFSAGIALVILGTLAIVRKIRFHTSKDVSSADKFMTGGSPVIAASTAIVIYLVLNVARVGGDFMFARFMIPVLPLIYYLIESLVNRLALFPKFRFAVPIALICFVVLETGLREKVLFHFDQKSGQLAGNWDGPDGGETHGIADERWVYMRKRFLLNGVERGSLDVYCDIGKYYEPFFEGLPVTVAITGAQNMIAYYANFHTCINEYGLTDKFIAHMPITGRGRIGHEKMAPEEYLIKRGVQLQFFSVVQKLPEQRSWDMAAFEIPEYGIWQIAKVFVYDKPIMDELFRRFRAAGIRAMLPKYEMIMPLYLNTTMPSLPVEQVKEDYESFKRLYFNRYPDPAAQKRIEDYIAQKSKS